MTRNPIIRYILHNQVIEALLLVALAWILLGIRNILVALFISYIIMAALSPMVEFLRKYKVPKTVAVTVSYLSALLFVLLLVVPLVPFFISQVQSLLVNFPLYLDRAAGLVGIKISADQMQGFINGELNLLSKNALTFTTKVFDGIFSLVTVLVVSFYLMLDHRRVKEGISSLFPEKHKADVHSTLLQIDEKLGAWLRGQLILSVFIGSLTWVALTLLNVEYALPLALIAGILEIIPTIGPIVSAIPAIIVVLNVSPAFTFVIIAVYMGIQAIENNFLVPKIMQRAVGLNPIVIILGIILGAELMGVVGALLSIPFISLLVIIFKSLKKFES